MRHYITLHDDHSDKMGFCHGGLQPLVCRDNEAVLIYKAAGCLYAS